MATTSPGWATPGAWGSVEVLAALLLPLVVEDDADDDGEDEGHQREEDDEEQGQATHGLQRCLHCGNRGLRVWGLGNLGSGILG